MVLIDTDAIAEIEAGKVDEQCFRRYARAGVTPTRVAETGGGFAGWTDDAIVTAGLVIVEDVDALPVAEFPRVTDRATDADAIRGTGLIDGTWRESVAARDAILRGARGTRRGFWTWCPAGTGGWFGFWGAAGAWTWFGSRGAGGTWCRFSAGSPSRARSVRGSRGALGTAFGLIETGESGDCANDGGEGCAQERAA